MECDEVTSLSTMKMQLSEDPEDWVWGRWYWCKPGAKPLLYHQAYGHPIWQTDAGQVPEGPRFLLESSVYASSRVSPFPGQEPHGRQEWFEEGIPLAAREGPVDPIGCGAARFWSDLDLAVSVESGDKYGYMVAMGGQRQGGTSFEAGGYAWVSAGGQRQGGISPAIYGYVMEAAGGQSQGGTAGFFAGSSWVADGGQLQGGTADQTAGYAWIGSGGQRQGGTAAEGGSYEWTASGGQREGGTAVQAAGYQWLAAGGQREGGAAAQGGSYAWVAAGGQREGGSTGAGGGYAFVASGGQRQGGTAAAGASLQWTASGGQRQGGAATASGGVAWTASGGQRQGGLTPQAGPHVQPVDGGQKQGGTAFQFGGYNFPALGGQRQGGTADAAGSTTALLGYAWGAAGGQKQGGTIVEYEPPNWVSSGGQKQGGAAVQGGAFSWVSSGGELQGGAAVQVGSYAWVASGGELQGGDSDPFGSGVMEFRINGILAGSRNVFNVNTFTNGRMGMVDNGPASRLDLYAKVPGEIMAAVPYVATQQSTSSTTFTDLGTVQTVTLNLDLATDVYIVVSALYTNSVSAIGGAIQVDVDGVGTTVVINTPAAINSLVSLSAFVKLTLAAGTRVVTMKFRVLGGTGFFSNRALLVQRGE